MPNGVELLQRAAAAVVAAAYPHVRRLRALLAHASQCHHNALRGSASPRAGVLAASSSARCLLSRGVRGGSGSDFSIGVNARGRHVVGGLARGVLSTLSAVEGVIQRLAIVTIVRGSLGAFEGADRGTEFVLGVLIGARGSRGVDGARACCISFSGGSPPHATLANVTVAMTRNVPRHAKRDRNILVSIRRPANRRRGDPCSTMHLLSPDDRPREKLWRHGAAALGDNELVALVLGTGVGGGGALHVANMLLAARGGLHGLMRSSLDEMAQVAGIGHARVAQLAAALELGRRTLAQAPRARVRLRTPHDAAAFLMPTYGARAARGFRARAPRLEASGAQDNAADHGHAELDNC